MLELGRGPAQENQLNLNNKLNTYCKLLTTSKSESVEIDKKQIKNSAFYASISSFIIQNEANWDLQKLSDTTFILGKIDTLAERKIEILTKKTSGWWKGSRVYKWIFKDYCNELAQQKGDLKNLKRTIAQTMQGMNDPLKKPWKMPSDLNVPQAPVASISPAAEEPEGAPSVPMFPRMPPASEASVASPASGVAMAPSVPGAPIAPIAPGMPKPGFKAPPEPGLKFKDEIAGEIEIVVIVKEDEKDEKGKIKFRKGEQKKVKIRFTTPEFRECKPQGGELNSYKAEIEGYTKALGALISNMEKKTAKLEQLNEKLKTEETEKTNLKNEFQIITKFHNKLLEDEESHQPYTSYQIPVNFEKKLTMLEERLYSEDEFKKINAQKQVLPIGQLRKAVIDEYKNVLVPATLKTMKKNEDLIIELKREIAQVKMEIGISEPGVRGIPEDEVATTISSKKEDLKFWIRHYKVDLSDPKLKIGKNVAAPAPALAGKSAFEREFEKTKAMIFSNPRNVLQSLIARR